jgi:hypothetical protein
MKPLTDVDPMPFGQYAGRPMQDIPASYLHYLWTNGLKDNPRGDDRVAVSDYIRRSLSALKLDHPDGVW